MNSVIFCNLILTCFATTISIYLQLPVELRLLIIWFYYKVYMKPRIIQLEDSSSILLSDGIPFNIEMIEGSNLCNVEKNMYYSMKEFDGKIIDIIEQNNVNVLIKTITYIHTIDGIVFKRKIYHDDILYKAKKHN